MCVWLVCVVCVCVCVCVRACDVQGHAATMNLLTGEDLGAQHGMVECEVPNRHLYDFVGNIHLNSDR